MNSKPLPKVAAHMNVLNDMEFLPYVLEGLLKAPIEKIMIVEMSEPPSKMARMINEESEPYGLSKDGTTEFLEEAARIHAERIMYYPLGFTDSMETARNLLVEQTPEDIEFLLRCDGDEVFLRNMLKFSFRLMQKHPGHIGMSGFHQFWKDLHHVIISEKPSHWTEWKPRILPFDRETRYVHPDYTTLDRRLPKLKLPLISYHLGWARVPARSLDRLIHYNFKWEKMTDYDRARAWALQHPFFTGDLDKPIYAMDKDIGMKVIPFEGVLPEVIRDLVKPSEHEPHVRRSTLD
jgi:hypothetical protein